MGTAGIDSTFEVSPDGITWTEPDGIDNYTFSEAGAKLSSTKFSQTTRAENSFKGLHSGSFSASGAWVAGDTNGQKMMKTAMRNGTAIWIRERGDGANGDKVQVKIYTMEKTSGVESRVERTFSGDFVSIPEDDSVA